MLFKHGAYDQKKIIWSASVDVPARHAHLDCTSLIVENAYPECG